MAITLSFITTADVQTERQTISSVSQKQSVHPQHKRGNLVPLLV